MSSLQKLTKARQYVRQRITNTYTRVNNTLQSLSEQDILLLTNRLQSLGEESKSLDKLIFDKLLETDASEATVDQHLSDADDYEDKIVLGLARLGQSSSERNRTNSGPASTPTRVSNPFTHSNHSHSLRLPVVSLPKYSNGSNESLEKFLYSFENITSKHNLTQYEKLVLLTEQLSGSPKHLISSLSREEQTYDVAKSLLQRAFASHDAQVNDTISRLVKLRLDQTTDPYTYVGDMRSVLDSFDKLQIGVEDIKLHFIWKGFNQAFRDEVIQMTNKSRPTLQEISDNVFEVIERYLQHRPKTAKNNSSSFKPDKPVDSSTYAVKVSQDSSKSYTCQLCRADNTNYNHAMRDCKKYNTPVSRVNKLESINGCTKCSFVNHSTNNCRFKFRTNCRHCNSEHMSYLCTHNNPSTSSNRQSNAGGPHDVITGMSLVEARACITYDDILLPTLTCEVTSKKGKDEIRVFKDSGAQRNIVSREFARKHNFPIVHNNVGFALHGMNATRNINSEIVSVPLKLGSVTYRVHAVVVPKITVKFSARGLETIIEDFISKGYQLSDKYLSKCRGVVDNVSFILGTDGDHVTELKYVKYGGNNNNLPSCFIECQTGILLSGNVKRMISNMSALPRLVPSEGVPPSSINVDHGNIPEERDLDIINTNVNFSTYSSILDDAGEIIDSKLDKAVNDALELHCDNLLKRDSCQPEPVTSEVNKKLTEHAINNTTRNSEGRLVIPLLWDNRNAHLLGGNFGLASKILASSGRKLGKNPSNLKMYHDVIKDHESMGVLERIRDLDSFRREHPECGFIGHMGVFRMNNDTTKLRVVLLSNLCERNKFSPNALSHNQTLLPGENLNHKISISTILYRFDRYLVIFDIIKAFLNVALSETDSNRLLILWFRNPLAGDFTTVAYKYVRLPFGLRCSPTILMLALHRILITDDDGNDERLSHLKRCIYNLLYVDNGGYTCNSEEEISWAYSQMEKVFSPYKFGLQKFLTNCQPLQDEINKTAEDGISTETKLLGLRWDSSCDTLKPEKIALNANATTKRQVLSSLNSVYDIFNIYAPLLVRSKLFLQQLQADRSLSWDATLDPVRLRTWTNIVRQVNRAPVTELKRFIGPRNGEYRLEAFTDSSQNIYGCVIYIVEIKSGQVSFLCAKSRLVNKLAEKRTIPMLELQAVVLGSELLIELYNDLSGDGIEIPINIMSLSLHTDSMVALHWIDSFSRRFDKMQKQRIFVMNRLTTLENLAKIHPITFHHITGDLNPADCLTRPMSPELYSRSNYICGPKFLTDPDVVKSGIDFSIAVPNEHSCESPKTEIVINLASVDSVENTQHLIPVERYSSFTKLVSVTRYVFWFIRKLRARVRHRLSEPVRSENAYTSAYIHIISMEQKIHYSEIFEFFNRRNTPKCSVPELVTQLNLFIDCNSLIRVKGKFSSDFGGSTFPVLLPKESSLTSLIIRDVHERNSHSGIYSVVRELRREFWIPKCFSRVKQELRKCVPCKRYNGRPIELNQNVYKEWRVSPPQQVFSSIFIDYMGPWQVELGSSRIKVWILVITCLHSRAVNLKVCKSSDTNTFLRALQLHVYEFGMFGRIMADAGSQITAGFNIMKSFLSDFDTIKYLQENKIERLEFEQYCTGQSSLGSIVESIVKITKRLIQKSIGSLILSYDDFEYLTCKTMHVANRRPIAFRDSVRDPPLNDLSLAITPEMLLHGHELTSLNIIPDLQESDVEDPNFNPQAFESDEVRTRYAKLKSSRLRLTNLYHSEFLAA